MKRDFHLGPWLVQPSLDRLSLEGRIVQVRPKVMDLLVDLAGSAGTVISKETLLNEVWRTEAISESALTRTITELRSAVRDDVDQPQFLETIPKRGYRLIAPVRPVASQEESHARRRRVPALVMRRWTVPAPTSCWSKISASRRPLPLMKFPRSSKHNEGQPVAPWPVHQAGGAPS